MLIFAHHTIIQPMATLPQLLKIAFAVSPDKSDITLDTLRRLDDTGAFAGKPALRFIMTTAVRNGAFSRFAACGAWNADAQTEIERFIAHTGFQPNLTRLVFSAYAESMQWLPADASQPDGLIASEPQGFYAAQNQPSSLQSTPPAISINREKEPYRGITIENANARVIESGRIVLNATVRRTSPLGSGNLGYSLTDANGNLLTSGIIATITATSPSVVPLTATIASAGTSATMSLCIS